MRTNLKNLTIKRLRNFNIKPNTLISDKSHKSQFTIFRLREFENLNS